LKLNTYFRHSIQLSLQVQTHLLVFNNRKVNVKPKWLLKVPLSSMINWISLKYLLTVQDSWPLVLIPSCLKSISSKVMKCTKFIWKFREWNWMRSKSIDKMLWLLSKESKNQVINIWFLFNFSEYDKKNNE